MHRPGGARDGRQVGLGAGADVHGVDFLARVDRLVLRTVGLEDRHRALVEGTEDAVVDQHAAPPDGISVVWTFSW